jgi:predicted phosphoribosyltransferase
MAGQFIQVEFPLFNSIKDKFQSRFKNRVFAANALAGLVDNRLKAEKTDANKDNLLVLGIPRGGVIVADIIASRMGRCDFDIIIPRKLTAPHNPELAIGSIMEDGTAYLNENLVRDLEIDQEYIQREKERQISEIRRRNFLYGGRLNGETIKEKANTVILVDDGAATGATLIAASRWIKEKSPMSRLMIGLPVAPKKTIELLQKECDHVEVANAISTGFGAVARYYQDFRQVTDEEVIEICKKRKKVQEW